MFDKITKEKMILSAIKECRNAIAYSLKNIVDIEREAEELYSFIVEDAVITHIKDYNLENKTFIIASPAIVAFLQIIPKFTIFESINWSEDIHKVGLIENLTIYRDMSATREYVLVCQENNIDYLYIGIKEIGLTKNKI